MRLQLIGTTIGIAVAGATGPEVLAQAADTRPEVPAYRMPANDDKSEIDFLANYYEQDGERGAVQGGRGTEQLDNFASTIVVRTPLDSNSALQVSAGADYYSSASTDRIDYALSTASSNDLRAYANASLTERDLASGRTYGVGLGVSREYDYVSVSPGLTLAQEWDRGQNELSVGVQAYFDRWDIILPVEFRGELPDFDAIESAGRQSYGLSVTYARIATPRLQFALTAELNHQRGLLSTPFHRVYFADARLPPAGSDLSTWDLGLTASDIERLPDRRTRVPLGLRVNYQVADALAVRTFARYYTDSWEVRGISGELELAYSPAEAWTLLPFARYYTQRAAEYWGDLGTHSADEAFYTSDFDLAEFTTTKAGLGLRYAPVFGLARGRLGRAGIEWTKVRLRGAYYTRNPDLEAYSVTFATSIGIRKRN